MNVLEMFDLWGIQIYEPHSTITHNQLILRIRLGILFLIVLWPIGECPQLIKTCPLNPHIYHTWYIIIWYGDIPPQKGQFFSIMPISLRHLCSIRAFFWYKRCLIFLEVLVETLHIFCIEFSFDSFSREFICLTEQSWYVWCSHLSALFLFQL